MLFERFMKTLTYLALVVIAGCSADAADAAESDTSDLSATDAALGTLIGAQTTIRGHHPIKVLDKAGARVAKGTTFSHDETFSIVYVDGPRGEGFFQSTGAIDAFIQVNTVKVHQGGAATDRASIPLTVSLKNNGNNTYSGGRPAITLSGKVGDGETVVSSVDVALFAHGGALAEQGFEQNYHFILDNVK